MKFHKEFVLIALYIIIIAPLFYFGVPFDNSSPDIYYVKGKVLQVLDGGLFADPVSGYPSMHPPIYHLLLAIMVIIGLSINTSLMIISSLIVAGIFYFSYKVLVTAFDKDTAFWTVLALPFIIEFMGCRNILLATSFYFSIPFYLAGLWLYLQSSGSDRFSAWAALLWGLAFIISPVYVFLLAFTFLLDLIKKDYRRFFLMTAIFGICIIPFIIQAGYIYYKGLWGTEAFALWRGFPDGRWFYKFFLEFVSPSVRDLVNLYANIHIFILLGAIIIAIKSHKFHWYLLLTLIAYGFTYYHFSGQYAIRIHLYFSLFLIAFMIDYLKKLSLNRWLWVAPTILISLTGLFYGSYKAYIVMNHEREIYEQFAFAGEGLWNNLDRHLTDGEFIFCPKATFFQYIMSHKSVHGLSAYKTLEYYQLNSELARELESDYELFITSEDYQVLEDLSQKYNIRSAVFNRNHIFMPPFVILKNEWYAVFQDDYFVILRKP